MDPEYPLDRLADMVEDSGARVLVTESDLHDRTGGRQVTRVDLDTIDWNEETIGKLEESDVSAENIAYVIYTSGSTGKPKGVQRLHRGVVNRLSWSW